MLVNKIVCFNNILTTPYFKVIYTYEIIKIKHDISTDHYNIHKRLINLNKILV